MNDVTKGEGRTVLFVSHNMGAIKGLCNKGIFLDKGSIISMGDIDKTIEQYYNKQGGLNGIFEIGKVSKDERVIIQKIVLSNQDNIQASSFKVGDDLKIELFLESTDKYERPYIYISIGNKFGAFTGANSLLDGIRISCLKKGLNIVKCTFKNLPLIPQEYFLKCGIRAKDGQTALSITKEIGSFIITSKLKDVGLIGELAESIANDSGSPLIPYEWDFGNGEIYSFNILDNVKR
jgi:lipopolysaccharide transport system ATP-binding protein